MDSVGHAQPVHYRSANVGGIDVFYLESGPDSAPVVPLLHGFPTSSRMFMDLIPRLSDAYHVIAPDYPAFGHSAMPDRSAFDYTFDHLADVVDALLGADLRVRAVHRLLHALPVSCPPRPCGPGAGTPRLTGGADCPTDAQPLPAIRFAHSSCSCVHL